LLATDKFMNLVEYRNLSSRITRDLIFFFLVGFEPWKITHASDNFGKLYDFAVDLIKR